MFDGVAPFAVIPGQACGAELARVTDSPGRAVGARLVVSGNLFSGELARVHGGTIPAFWSKFSCFCMTANDYGCGFRLEACLLKREIKSLTQSVSTIRQTITK
jgi:hypothetical protein